MCNNDDVPSDIYYYTGGYSDLTVMQSAAGYYVCTYYYKRDKLGNHLFTKPGSRESQYFTTKESAQAFLDYLTRPYEDLQDCRYD